MPAELVAMCLDPAALAKLAKGDLHPKQPESERALTGRFGPRQRFLVGEPLAVLAAPEPIRPRLRPALAASACPIRAKLFQRRPKPWVYGRRTCPSSRFPFSAPSSLAARIPPTHPR